MDNIVIFCFEILIRMIEFKSKTCLLVGARLAVALQPADTSFFLQYRAHVGFLLYNC